MNNTHASIAMGNPLRRRLLAVALMTMVGAAAMEPAYSQNKDTPRNYAVQAGDLGNALDQLASQAGMQIVYPGDLVRGKKAVAINGQQTLQNALQKLLKGTGLTWGVVNDNTIVVKQAEAPSRPAKPVPTQNKVGGTQENEAVELEKMVVTGTRIRGVPISSPVVTITAEEMRLSGHNNLGEAIRALPQNFAGGQNPGVALGAEGAQASNGNITGGSTPNLRGLGPDATLTLLNGTRLPYDGLHQATDVSVIPVAAIDRMEVLLDGASAIYGSDAVGGVVNIILKPDYKGAELSTRFGAATDGGFKQTQYTALAGNHWGSGGFLVTGDISRNTPVRAKQRDYLDYLRVPSTTLYPDSNQKSVLLSGHQGLGDIAELTLDTFYTDRSSSSQRLTELRADVELDSKIWGFSPALKFELPGDWTFRVHGFVGRDESEIAQGLFNITTGALFIRSGNGAFNKTEAAGVEAEGPLFDLPGGSARLSVGGGWRRNTFDQKNLITEKTLIAGESRNYNAYGEIYLPLISNEQNIPFVRKLSLNGALRHENYDTFGKTTTPKIGAIWGLTPALEFRASWGRSFKVPRLAQQFAIGEMALLPAAFFTGAPATGTVVLRGGGNPDLGPERAKVITAGFVAEPEFLPGFGLEFGWFDIDYTDRVVSPVTGSGVFGVLVDPTIADFVTINPTVAQLTAAFEAAGLPVGGFTSNSGNPNFTPRPYDPTEVRAMIDSRNVNASSSHMRGVDLSVRYSMDLLGGSLALSANGNWIQDAARQLTARAPEQETSGLIFWPAEFKGRFGTSWSRGGFTFSSVVNHVGGVTNNRVTPNVRGSSMTTLDLVFDQQIDSESGGLGLNLAVSNVFNKRPPFMRPQQNYYVNYDSTNYSALGRVVSVTLTKRF